MIEDVEKCPACGCRCDTFGCVTHEQAGTFCRAPNAPRPRMVDYGAGLAIITHDVKPKEKRAPLTFAVPPSAPIAKCRSCGSPVVWIMTATGRRMPVNPDTRESHFATCPQSAEWRRK